MTEKTRSDIVHVVDDNDGVRDLVVRALESVGVNCMAWDSPETFLERAHEQPVDLLVVDIRLVGMSGLELVRRARARSMAVPVIFISGIDEVSVAVDAMKLGAHDFLPKPFAAQVLIDSVQAALRSGREQAGREASVAQARAVLAKLSPRERQVFLSVVDGKPNKVIAFDLGLSEKTVEEHRKHVMTKLAASSVADLVKMAVLGGVCDPGGVSGGAVVSPSVSAAAK